MISKKIISFSLAFLIIMSMCNCVYSSNDLNIIDISFSSININMGSPASYSVKKIGINTYEDIVEYSVDYDKSKLLVDLENHTVSGLDTGISRISFHVGSYTKVFDLCVNDPEDKFLLEGKPVYAQDFEGNIGSVFTTNSLATIEQETGNKYLKLNGQSSSINVGPFGPEGLSNYLVEADVQLISTGAGATTSLGFNLRGDSSNNAGYRFSYNEIMKIDPTLHVLGTGTPETLRNAYGIFRSKTATLLSSWYLDKAVLGDSSTYNSKTRGHNKPYKWGMYIMGDKIWANVKDENTVYTTTSTNLSDIDFDTSGIPLDRLASGKTSFLIYNGVARIDNIKIRPLSEIAGISLALSKEQISGVDVDNTVTFAVSDSNRNIVDESLYSISCEDSNVSISGNSITASAPGEYLIKADCGDKQSIAVLKVNTDNLVVKNVCNTLALGIDSALVKEDFKLPTSDDAMIYWTSSNSNIVSINASAAVVTRPAQDEHDASVDITAIIVKNSSFIKKVFTITIKRMPTDTEKIDELIKTIGIPLVTSVNITLPISEDGVNITWHSSDTKIITNTGVVNRPKGHDVPVVLTANMSIGSYSKSACYTITVNGQNLPSSKNIMNLNLSKNTADISESISFSFKRYDDFGIWDIEDYIVTPSDNAITVDKEKHTISSTKEGLFDIEFRNNEGNFIQTAKVAFNDENNPFIIEKENVYEEDFEGSTIDSAFVGTNYSLVNDNGNNMLQILGKSKNDGTPEFGPRDSKGALIPLSDYMIEADVYMNGCDASTQSQISIGMRNKSNDAYHLSYSDVLLLLPNSPHNIGSARTGTYTVGNNMFSLSRGGGVTASEWYFNVINPAPSSIYLSSKRTFNKMYKLVGKILNGTMVVELVDGTDNVFKTSSTLAELNYNKDGTIKADIISGNTRIMYHSTNALIDNIKISEIKSASSLGLILSKNEISGLMGDDTATCELTGYSKGGSSSIIDKSMYEITCDNPDVVIKDNTIKVSKEGTYYIVAKLDNKTAVTILNVSANINAIADEALKLTINKQLDNIRSSFELPTLSTVDIVWGSSNNNYASIDGNNVIVVRPAIGQSDVNLTITAMIIQGNCMINKNFNMTIKAEISSSDALSYAIEEVVIPNKAKDDITLPVINEDNVLIEWTSNNTSVITNSGDVTRPNGGDVSVQLTAKYSRDNVKKSVVYIVVVEGYGNNSINTGGGSAKTNGGSINAEFIQTVVQPEQEKKLFADLADVPWAEQAILELAAKKLINGVSDGVFDPNSSVKREEFTKMLITALGYTLSQSNSFQDVNMNDWFAVYVSTAKEQGLVGGIGDNVFGVGSEITKQDICAIIARSLINKGVSLDYAGTQRFNDDDMIDDYAKNAVYAIRRVGIITGMGDGYFNPKGKATRAEAVVIIWRLLNYK